MKSQTTQSISLQKLLILHSDYVNELHKRSPETRGTYERTLREFMRWVRHETDMEYSVRDIERYKKYLLTKRNLSPVSVTMYLSSVRKFFDYLVKRDALQHNPARAVKGGSPYVRLTRKSISIAGVQSLLESIERTDEIGYRDFVIVQLMLSCGVSEIELIRADIGDLTRKRKHMQLALQGKGKKTKESVIVIPAGLQQPLKDYLAYRTNAAAAEPLFMSAGNRTRGERMTSRGIRERINFYLTKSGVKNGEMRRITALSLRNTAITRQLEQGANVEDIKTRFRIAKDATVKMYQTMDPA